MVNLQGDMRIVGRVEQLTLVQIVGMALTTFGVGLATAQPRPTRDLATT